MHSFGEIITYKRIALLSSLSNIFYMNYCVKKHGSFIAEFPNENECYNYILATTNTSIRFAMMHLGYSVEKNNRYSGYHAAYNTDSQ